MTARVVLGSRLQNGGLLRIANKIGIGFNESPWYTGSGICNEHIKWRRWKEICCQQAEGEEEEAEGPEEASGATDGAT